MAMIALLLAAAGSTLAQVALASRGHPVPNPDGPYLKNPCLNNSKFTALPFCDPTLGLDEPAADIIKRLVRPHAISVGDRDCVRVLVFV